MNELALFAGAGGGLLASRLLGWRTVCAVERDCYRQAVILARQADGCLDPFPIWDDVRTFDGRPWRGLVDVVTAGFPCQPFSIAGKRRGEADERNMWPDTIRVIREVGPRFALLENVRGLLGCEYFGIILGDLAEAGFDAEWCVLGADDVGAPHRRKRVWILAYAAQEARRRWSQRQARLSEQCCKDVAYATGARREERREPAILARQQDVLSPERCDLWRRDPADEGPAAESYVGRLADGVAHRVDRLAAIGDGQVPLVAAVAWMSLIEEIER